MKWVLVTGLLATLLRFGGGSVLPPVASPVIQEPVAPEPVNRPSAAQQVECLAGSEWISNCHYCRCSDSGVAECLKEETCDDGIFEEPLQCKPNTTFVRDCNTCVCLENGLALCTLEFCRRSDMRQEPELKEGVECAPGTSWKNRCSACRCSDAGYRQCDPIQCEEKDKESDMYCAPGTRWKKECNTCSCNRNGHGYCTLIGCITITDLNFDKQRNKNNDDKQFSDMIKKSSKNTTKDVICVANRMFIKDCNTCWCNDDGTSYFCTRKVCVPELPDESSTEEEKPEQELRIIEKDCRPDEVFELDCNMCRCNSDGKSFSCTRRACINQEELKNMTTLARRVRATPQESPKTCQPGQEFRLDCNKCLCDNEGQDFSCTRIDCNALNNNNNGGSRSKRGASDLDEISSDCTPGSVFEKECNTCRCTTDGHHAVCTNKRCTPEVKQNTSNADIHSTESDPGFRCDPGEQFKKDCKDCTCSADGKSYFCTLHLCDEFIAPGI